MIRVALNLARRPAENLRRIWILWGGGLALLALLFIVLGAVALVGWSRTRQVKAQTDAVRAQVAPMLANAQAAQAPLNDPGIRRALEQSAFLNSLIDRKSVSWTRLFERLEAILPPEVELVSLRPIERQGVSAVDLRFASDSLDPAIEFVNQLEKSGDFTQARVEREGEATQSATVNGGGRGGEEKAPRFQIEVTALYRPLPDDSVGDTGDHR